MKVRKRPVVVDAVQFTEAMARGEEALPSGVRFGARELGPPPECKLQRHHHYIKTLEGKMSVEIGDWIIMGVAGEFYPCKPDIFAATYEPAE